MKNLKLHIESFIKELFLHRINKKSNLKGQTQRSLDESISLDGSDDEGLALLIPDIQETASLVQSATYSDPNNKDDSEQSVCSLEYGMGSSIEQKYLDVMKKLQFGKLMRARHKCSVLTSNFLCSQTLSR